MVSTLSVDGIAALGAQNGLESMLAAWMLSIHQLQQRSMAYANAPQSKISPNVVFMGRLPLL